MKRDFFNRGVRMQHQFGGIEKVNDPLLPNTWEAPDFPFAVKRLSGTGSPCEIQEFGLKPYRPDPSPICKPDHSYAETEGKPMDEPEAYGRPVAVGTRRRTMSGGANALSEIGAEVFLKEGGKK